MIRFKIKGGDFLDLPSDFNFSFLYNNGIFAFENMQLNRSGEFSIPATPKNNRLLGFSNNPNNNGEGTRKKISAELYYSGGKIDGTLFFGKFSGSYSAVFIYGELEALKRANDRGVIKNYTSFPQVLNTNTQTITPAYSADGLLANSFKFYNYRNGIPEDKKLVNYINSLPTVKLKTLLDAAKMACGINVNMEAIGTAKDAIGVILGTNTASPFLETCTVVGKPYETILTGGSSYFQLGTVEFKWQDYFALFSPWHKKTIRVLVAKRDCTVIVKNEVVNYVVATGNGSTFLYDYDTTNAPIAKYGSTFDLKKGDYFAFINFGDYFFRIPYKDYSGYVNSVFDVYSVDASTVEKGENFPLHYNLPEVSFVDLLKIYANLFKCGIDYDIPTNTVNFFKFDFDKSSAIELDSALVDIKSVDRTFLNYAKRNAIEFKSEDYIESRERITYKIENDNISDEKTLYTIPFSEGIRGINGDVELKDFELVEPYKLTAKNGTICVASKNEGQSYLKHISQLYENFAIPDNLKAIIFNSTTVVVQLRMDAKNFLQIKNKNVFKLKGKHYCCINGTHSDNISELTLVKI